MKSKILAIAEILMVYGMIRLLGGVVRSTGITNWELQNLGWSYTGMALFIGIPALVIWLMRRNWVTYGVTSLNWQINLDLGIQAYLIRLIPIGFFLGMLVWLKMDYRTFSGGGIVALGEVIGIMIMFLLLNREREAKAISAARSNVITTVLLFLFPIILALALGRLSLIVVDIVSRFWLPIERALPLPVGLSLIAVGRVPAAAQGA